MGSSSARFDLERFDGTGDFSLWKEKMMAILICQKLDIAIEEGIDPDDANKKESETVMKQARSAIIMNLADNVLRQVIGEKTALRIWNRLNQLYMAKSTATKIFLKGKFYGFKMNATISLEQNLDDLNKIVLSLTNMGEIIKEEDQVVIILNALPEQFKELKTVIMYSRDTLTLEDVMSTLRSRDAEMNWQKAAKQESKSDEVLMARGRPLRRGNSKKRWNSNSRSRSKSRPKETRKCHHCGKVGHLISNCWELKNKKKKGKEEEEKGNGSNAVIDDQYSSDGDVFTITKEIIPRTSQTNGSVYTGSGVRDEDEWILDSGCTYHMCPNRKWFIDYSEVDEGSVIMGNDHKCKVAGIGTIAIKNSDGTIKTLENVRHIPDLKRNLISLGTLDDEGYEYKSGRGTMRITKGSLLVMKGIKRHGLYFLNGETIPPAQAATVSKNKEDSKLWHARMGHISEQGLIELSRQGLLSNYSHANLPFCEICVQGKQHKIKFSQSSYRAKQILEYIHADLWGASRIKTPGGNQYFLSIIDDHSRKIWVFLLKHKNECLEKFKNWKVFVETQTDCKIKTFRTDNGLEFINDEFNELCIKYGISNWCQRVQAIIFRNQ